MKKVALAIGAVALAGAPVVAQSLPTVAPVADESELEGGNGIVIAALGLGIAALVVLGLSDDDNRDELPVSS